MLNQYDKMYAKLYELGGAGADNDWTRGWDEAITAAIKALEEVSGMSEKEFLERMEREQKFYLNSVEVEIPNIGKLVAEECSDPNYPGISIFIRRPDGHEVDVALAEKPFEQEDVHCYVWSDVNSEEYTDAFCFQKDDVLNTVFD